LDSSKIIISPELSNNKVILKSSGRRTTLNTMSTSEFIKTNFDEPEHKIEIDPELFSNAIKLVSKYHVPYNDPQLSIYRGIELMIGTNGFVRASATDGFIGAVYQKGDYYPDSNKVVVMGEQLSTFTRILSSCDELQVGVPQDDDSKLFIYGWINQVKIKIAIQMLSEQDRFNNIYAGFQAMLENPLTTVILDKSEMIKILKPIDAYDDIFVKMLIEEDRLSISAEDEHVGSYDAVIECDVEQYVEPIAFKINKKYFKSVLANSVGFVHMNTSNKIHMIIFIPDENDDESQYYQGVGKIASK
jgi:DNA polymerase III sliding clamp (beta) subunit (PCNA family)